MGIATGLAVWFAVLDNAPILLWYCAVTNLVAFGDATPLACVVQDSS